MTTRARRIRILDSTLANQIAAGEVIERPASVLKELLENSIDAGADRIRVALEQGGTGLIEVRDNGAGIPPGELALALERHATSKISTLEELDGVHSLGFRGEALPSIASVSRLSLTSRVAGDDSGWRLRCEGGVPGPAPEPAAQPPGTTIQVRDLFFNTPARRKFLRSRRTELQHLESCFRRLALVYFQVRLELLHDGRSLLRLAAADTAAARRQRLGRLLGKDFSSQALEVDQHAGGWTLQGWLGAPRTGRERNDMQYLYINGRAVSDPVCRHALRLAYDDLLPSGRQPAWVLYLSMDPRQVDVNVHPAKQEVRFHEARMVHDFIRSAAHAVLASQTHSDGAGVAPAYRFGGAAGGTAGAWPLAEPLPAADSGSRPEAAPVPDPGAGNALEGLYLLQQRWWLGRSGDRLYIADIQALAEHLCRDALEHLLKQQQPQSRPLLLPVALVLQEESAAEFEDNMAVLARLGLEIRGSGPGRGMLLAVPLALAQVPGDILAGCICEVLGTAAASIRAEAWIAHLARCAGQHTAMDLRQAGQLLEHLLQLEDTPPEGIWRQLRAGDLQRWLGGTD